MVGFEAEAPLLFWLAERWKKFRVKDRTLEKQRGCGLSWSTSCSCCAVAKNNEQQIPHASLKRRFGMTRYFCFAIFVGVLALWCFSVIFPEQLMGMWRRILAILPGSFWI